MLLCVQYLCVRPAVQSCRCGLACLLGGSAQPAGLDPTHQHTQLVTAPLLGLVGLAPQLPETHFAQQPTALFHVCAVAGPGRRRQLGPAWQAARPGAVLLREPADGAVRDRAALLGARGEPRECSGGLRRTTLQCSVLVVRISRGSAGIRPGLEWPATRMRSWLLKTIVNTLPLPAGRVPCRPGAQQRLPAPRHAAGLLEQHARGEVLRDTWRPTAAAKPLQGSATRVDMLTCAVQHPDCPACLPTCCCALAVFFAGRRHALRHAQPGGAAAEGQGAAVLPCVCRRHLGPAVSGAFARHPCGVRPGLSCTCCAALSPSRSLL